MSNKKDVMNSEKKKEYDANSFERENQDHIERLAALNNSDLNIIRRLVERMSKNYSCEICGK